MAVDLREDWADLLERRRAIASSLVPYGPVVDAWAQWEPPAASAPAWDPGACEERWRRGVPLLAESRLDLTPADVEDMLAVAMEAVTATRPEEAAGMRRLADEWDAERLDPSAFLPTRGAVGEEAVHRLAIRPAIVGFLAYAGLRPAVEWSLTGARSLLADGVWSLGVCPFCGAPPGFADIIESGQRQLTCHLCGGRWIFSRVRCPLCGADAPREQARLEPGGADEAYFISGCTRCKGYVKELDRRQRWNARTAVVEDWGSPHLDLAARQAGYWRPIPTLLEVATPI
jgi:FdhE protein